MMTRHQLEEAPLSLYGHLHLLGTLQVAWMDARLRAMLPALVDVLHVRGTRLLAPSAQHALDRCLGVATAGKACALLIPRQGKLPLTLRLVPQAAHKQAPTDVLIILRDPEAERPDTVWLQHLFGLTRTEAAITTALSMGHHTADIAQMRGVQTNTIRAHLKKVLAKTGMPHQVALVSLVLRSAVMTPHGGGMAASSIPPANEGTSATQPPGLAQVGNDIHAPSKETANRNDLSPVATNDLLASGEPNYQLFQEPIHESPS